MNICQECNSLPAPYKKYIFQRDDLVKKADFLQRIRNFFAAKDVIEVSTAVISAATVTDINISSIECSFAGNIGYLQTSPEFAMKRLLVAGSGCIFQICPAFRDDCASHIHKIEFTMLEWYRVGYNYKDLMAEITAFVQLFWPKLQIKNYSYQEVFLQQLQLDIFDTNLSDLHKVLENNSTLHNFPDSIDGCLDAIMSLVIMPSLAEEPAIIIYDYPASQAALAQISNLDNRVSERFELFLFGIEIANGFTELTSHNEQLTRFEADNKSRVAAGLAAMPIDYDFISSLEQGLPACAGVAVGIDRLYMLYSGAKEI